MQFLEARIREHSGPILSGLHGEVENAVLKASKARMEIIDASLVGEEAEVLSFVERSQLSDEGRPVDPIKNEICEIAGMPVLAPAD